MSKRIDKDEEYTKDFIEWQDKQYLPGAYLGGNFPIDIKHGNRKLMSIMFLVVVIFCLLGLVGMFNSGAYKNLSVLPAIVFFALITILYIIFIIKYLFKRKHKHIHKHKK
jgi:hypothetical protein